MLLIEDLLSEEDLEAIERVLASDSPRFDLLVKAAGLDPKIDFMFSDFRRLNFCGADLRGYNFYGSDLRFSVRNNNTIIDETTIFTKAKLDWIQSDALPIVTKMQEVEKSASSERRKVLLGELIGEFGKSTHVVSYMVSAAVRATTLEDFLDFALFLPPTPNSDQSKLLLSTAQKLLKKKLASNKNRTRRDKTAVFAIDKIVDKLKSSKFSLGERIYSHLVEIVTAKHETIALKGMASIEPKDIEAAFSRIGR